MLGLLQHLPQATSATEPEVLTLIGSERLWDIGIGYVDAHLLAAGRLTPARLWTNDQRLAAAAARLGSNFDPSSLEEPAR